MNNCSLSKKFFVVAILWSCVSGAQGFLYSDLKMKDFDEMTAMINKHIKKAQSLEEQDLDKAKIELELAVLEILSRPNSDDNLVSKLIPIVRTPLNNLEYFDTALTNVIQRALHTAKDSKAKPKIGATSLIILKNFMSEFKPDIKNKPTIRELVVAIKKAKIEPSPAVRAELNSRGMQHGVLDPSGIASSIISAAK